jgi:hypothetical protein
MSVPQIITINDINYYDAKGLYVYDKTYFYGCSKSIKTIITKKNINEDMYIYASYNKKKGWTIYNKCSIIKKSTLLLKEEWVINNIPKMNTSDKEIKYDIKEVPERLYLEDHELFQDEEGNYINIEVYGERDPDKCYFKAKSIEEGFNIPNLCDTVSNNRGTYILNNDYKCFISNKPVNNRSIRQKELYLTYEGLLTVLYTSRKNRTRHFKKWATRILFVAQMGTDEQRTEVATEIMSHVDEMKRCLKASSRKMSCIYFLKLGTTKDLREVFKIDSSINDNYLVCKYGKGEDLERRLGEHERDYGKIEGVNIEVIKYAYIDPKFINEAELCVSHFFNVTDNKLTIDKRKELFYINSKNLRFLEAYIVGIQNKYIGSCELQAQQTEKYKEQVINLKIIHQKDLEIKDGIIAKKDVDIENRNLIIENMKLKNLLQNNL